MSVLMDTKKAAENTYMTEVSVIVIAKLYAYSVRTALTKNSIDGGSIVQYE